MPPPLATAMASLTGAGSARSSTGCQPVSTPSSTTPWKTVVVGAPLASVPPMMYGTPDRLA